VARLQELTANATHGRWPLDAASRDWD